MHKNNGDAKKARPGVFAVTEEPFPVSIWRLEDGNDLLAVVERDIAELTRASAQARFDLEVKERENRDKTRRLLLELLKPVDAFERLFDAIRRKDDNVTGQMKIWINNFRTIHKLIRTTLEQQGVVEIQNLDQGFDPRWHEVRGKVLDMLKPEGIIVEVVERGYVLGDFVLRKTAVKVVTHDPRDIEEDTL